MIISFDEVFKSFNGNFILEDISFKIEPQDRIGLIGSNGAGKTTLLRMITGEEIKDKGEINLKRNISIGFLKQNNALDSNNNIYEEMLKPFDKILETKEKIHLIEKELKNGSFEENSDEYKKLGTLYSNLQAFFESNDGYNIDVKIKTVLNGMGFSEKSLKTRIETLSGGEKTRLALSKLLLMEPELLILDEPTNHLDFKTLFWLEDYLSNYKGALLIVSHDRFFLDKLTNKIFEIEFKNLNEYKGNYSKYVLLKEERFVRQEKEYEIQQKKISELKDYVAKNMARASTSASAKSRLKELEKMEIIPKPKKPNAVAKFHFDFLNETGKDVLLIENMKLSVGDFQNKKQLFQNLCLDIKKGEKVAIIGPNGVGKTSFFKAIINLIPSDEGKVFWGKNVKIAYFEQEGATLELKNTVIDELWKHNQRKNQFEIRSELGKVLLTGENVFKKVGVISGGERAKLNLAILMSEKANVLLLDEPTNHLDLATKESLEKALNEFEGTVIIISHDRYLLTKIPTKIVEFTKSGANEYPGNYNIYLEKSRQNNTIVQKENKSFSPQTENSIEMVQKSYKTKQQRANLVKMRQLKNDLEIKTCQKEQQIKTLEFEITQEDIYSDFEKMNEKCLEINRLKEEFEIQFEELLNISDLLENN